jgi:hypothetical protein
VDIGDHIGRHLVELAVGGLRPLYELGEGCLGVTARPLSLPLAGVPQPAALNLYAGTPDAFLAPASRQVADLLARCVSRLMPWSRPGGQRPGQRRRRRVGPGPRRPPGPGPVTTQHQLSRVDALALLIRRSRIEARSIHDVAEDVAGGGGAEAAS